MVAFLEVPMISRPVCGLRGGHAICQREKSQRVDFEGWESVRKPMASLFALVMDWHQRRSARGFVIDLNVFL
jgi:hypothetical protein